MHFADKLDELTKDANRSAICRAAELPPNAISDYINKRYLPRVDIALRLARALDVPLEWLVDPNTEPPKPEPKVPSPAMFSDGQLMAEVAMRYRRAALDLLAALKTASSIDWGACTLELQRTKDGDPIPAKVQQALSVLAEVEIRVGRVMQDFDADFYSTIHHGELPGAELKADELVTAATSFAYGGFSDRDDVQAFSAIARSRPALTIPADVRLYKERASIYHESLRESQPWKAGERFKEKRMP